MNLSAPFVRRPIGTTLLTIGIALAGIAAYFQLPVSPLPQFDLPSISVQARLPGASPENMATSVATPLEKRLGRLAAVSEMTSRSGVGQTQIQLQFDLSRDIDGAARDVMAAINASRADLPSTLRSNPSYRKFNPADQPIIILSMTSKTRTRTDIYDSAATIIQQQLSQVKGVGDVGIQGGALPAVRVELNPLALARYGIALEDVRAAISASNANRPKGVIDSGIQRYQIYTNDAGRFAKDYSGLVIAYRNGRAVRLSDVAQVVDGPEDIHNTGLVNGQNAVTVVVSRAPGANIIQTVDAVKARLPTLRAAIPQDIELQPVIDRSITIRASLADVERTLAISTILVILVVAFFLQSGGATLVPSVAVTVSLLGTIGVMFLLGFSLNNLSLMALTISTGFVVDDAIVVLENITRNVEKGMPRFQAALKGAQEVGFTVLSISVSLIAV
ncbi:MAG: efflux RND transporter permease subunit, partial [Caulobacteraceae bacterium]